MSNRQFKIVASAAGLFALVTIGVWWLSSAKDVKFTTGQLRLPDQSLVNVEIADSVPEQELGLMGRDQLASDAGMLFVFPVSAKYPFWMKNTKIDLDYVWLLRGVVVDLTANVPAGDGLPDQQITRVAPKNPVDWVLEVQAGFIAAHQLQVGDRLDETK